MSGTQDVVVAAGIKSMTRVPIGSNFRLHADAGLSEEPWSRAVRDRYQVAEISQSPARK